MTLKRKAVSAVRWTSISAVFKALLQVLQVSILARILVPEDFGLMAMVTIALGFISLLVDLGLNSAYLQARDVTVQQRSSLYWCSVALGVLLALLLVAISPIIALYFAEPRIVPLLIYSAPMLIFSAVGQQLRINAQKELRFFPLVASELASLAVGFVVAVVLAVLGYGVYALVWAALANSLFGSVLAWLFLARGWRPLPRMRLAEIKPFIRFSMAVFANGLVNYVNTTLDLLLGGRLLDSSSFGLYSVPRNLVLQLQFLFNPVFTRVGFPVFAAIQDDRQRTTNVYLKMMNMTASVNAPLYLGIAFFSPVLVTLLLGENWREASGILRLLAIWGFVRSLSNPVGSLLLGMGRADISFRWNIALLLLMPPVLWLGSMQGVVGLVWSLLLLAMLMFVPVWFFLVRPFTNVKLFDYTFTALRPTVLAIVSISLPYMFLNAVEPPVLKMIFAVIISATLYLMTSYYVNREWVDALSHFALVNKVESSKSGTK